VTGEAGLRLGARVHRFRTGLWANKDFVRLWSAESISLFGSLISGTALAFAAILTLHATAFQIALLGIAEMTPAFLLSLFAGAWVDRLPRRPILITSDLARAVLLMTVPIAALFDVLRIEQLYLIAALASIFSTFFDVAYQSYLPSLVQPDELVEGNSKLAASAAVSETAAFSSAGWLVQLLSAPGAIVIDAVSFLASAYFVRRIEAPEAPPKPKEERQHIREEIVDGIRLLLREPILRSLAVSNVILNFAFRVNSVVYLLYVSRELGFKPGALGLIFAVGGVSSLAGSLFAGRVTLWLGLGPAMITGLVLTGAGQGLIAFASGVTVFSAVLLVAQQLVADAGATVYIIDELSLRQVVAPANAMGRINGSMRVLDFGAMLVGAVVGGWLGTEIGLRFTVVFASTSMALGGVWLARTPVRKLHSNPEPVVEPLIEPQLAS
jgi:Na+/melibiose symporter-like transporter